MKHLRLYENFGVLPGDTEKNLEEVITEYINFEIIEDLKDICQDFVDEYLSLNYNVYIINKEYYNKSRNIEDKLKHSQVILSGEYDKNDNYKEFVNWDNNRNFELKYINGISYNDIKNNNFKLMYGFSIFSLVDGEPDIKLTEDIFQKQENEALRRIKIIYDDEYIFINRY